MVLPVSDITYRLSDSRFIRNQPDVRWSPSVYNIIYSIFHYQLSDKRACHNLGLCLEVQDDHKDDDRSRQ